MTLDDAFVLARECITGGIRVILVPRPVEREDGVFVEASVVIPVEHLDDASFDNVQDTKNRFGCQAFFKDNALEYY